MTKPEIIEIIEDKITDIEILNNTTRMRDEYYIKMMQK